MEENGFLQQHFPQKASVFKIYMSFGRYSTGGKALPLHVL